MKRKLERFKIIEERDNVIERSKDIYENIKGKWRSDYFKNENPITVELPVEGKIGLGLAARFPIVILYA